MNSPPTTSTVPKIPPITKFRYLLGNIGKNVLDSLRFCGGLAFLAVQVCRELVKPPYYFRLTIEQIYLIGVNSFLLVAVTGMATGSVMALQFGYGLAKFGGKLYVPKIVSLSILREMGPVFTSLLLAGRVGSGIASEVASMKVTQQIDAMRALGTSPIKRIVIPRVLACMISVPLLTLFADFIGILSAMMVAASELNINREFFATKAVDNLIAADVLTGLAKTVVFGFFISLCACYKGLTTEGGTAGVGSTTTFVVVASSIFIMISDVFLTKLFLILFYPV